MFKPDPVLALAVRAKLPPDVRNWILPWRSNTPEDDCIDQHSIVYFRDDRPSLNYNVLQEMAAIVEKHLLEKHPGLIWWRIRSSLDKSSWKEIQAFMKEHPEQVRQKLDKGDYFKVVIEFTDILFQPLAVTVEECPDTCVKSLDDALPDY